ncbi:MAG: tetratricopeptide repeat protein, partial [Planctomycetota bacterium]
MRCVCLISVALCFAITVLAAAHQGPHQRIIAKNKQIQNNPENAQLYLERGELHRQHGDWDAAFVDFQRAEELAPKLTEIDLARGRMLLDAGWLKSARFMLTRFLNKKPDHAQGHRYHAHTLAKLGEHLAAAAEYTRAITLTSPTDPELYIWRAQNLADAGNSYIKEAISGLDKGMQKFGKPLLTLQLAAIELELKRKNYDAALKRLETLTAQSHRKESWLA